MVIGANGAGAVSAEYFGIQMQLTVNKKSNQLGGCATGIHATMVPSNKKECKTVIAYVGRIKFLGFSFYASKHGIRLRVPLGQ